MTWNRTFEGDQHDRDRERMTPEERRKDDRQSMIFVLCLYAFHIVLILALLLMWLDKGKP